ncbi:MAG: hypothetical protein E7I17_13655 [Citrobacter freundii]|nr:hypothetical protein [Citrobacter freundii]
MLYCERFIVSHAFGDRQCSSVIGIVGLTGLSSAMFDEAFSRL